MKLRGHDTKSTQKQYRLFLCSSFAQSIAAQREEKSIDQLFAHTCLLTYSLAHSLSMISNNNNNETSIPHSCAHTVILANKY